MSFSVVEQFLCSKTGCETGGEDRLVITANFAAVIDGATAKHDLQAGQRSPGALAADAIAEAVAKLDPESHAKAAVAWLDRAVASIAPDGSEAPTAVCALYSNARREVWIAGDVGVRIGEIVRPARKALDDVAAAVRAAILRAELLSGISIESLRQHDPGRDAILPLLKRQGAFANRSPADPLSFCTLDGQGRAQNFVEVMLVPDAATVVLSSDGYLSPAPSLREAEAELMQDLQADPLRILNHPTTKAVADGAQSFDDRSYVRLRT